MAGKGTSYFTKRSRERKAQFSNPFVYLRDDGEKARIRFLAEMKDGLFSGVFHRPWVKGRLQSPVICVEQDTDPPSFEGMTETCTLCTPEENPRLQFFLWVYVYYLLHPTQNPALEKDRDAPQWKAVKVGKGDTAKTMFKQDVNKVKILMGGKRMMDFLIDLEADAATEGESLLDSDYNFIRHGARKSSDTNYVFTAIKNSAKLKDEVKEAIGGLEDITEVALEGTAAFFTSGAKADAPEEEPEALEEGEEEAKAQEETEVPEESDGGEDFANL